MAGSIIISKDSVWSTSTMTLDTIAFRTKEAFGPELVQYQEAIFSQLDVFQFIALDELDSAGYNSFCRATTKAFECFRDAGPRQDWPADYHPGMLKAWSALLAQLGRDPRYASPEPPTYMTSDEK